MVLTVLLDDMSAPPRHAPARKCGDERPRVQAQRLEHERRVELDIRPKIPPGLHFLEHLENRLLGGTREIEQLPVLPCRGANLVGDFTEHVVYRTGHLV